MTRRQTTGRDRTGVVTDLGDRGDGIVPGAGPGAGNNERHHVAGALPLERIRFREGMHKTDGPQGHLLEILEPSKDRVTPPCPHAAQCGGCDLQHLDPVVLATWKREKVLRALGHRGLDQILVRDTQTIPPGTRRRLAVGLRGRKDAGVVGFRARASHTLIDTPACLLPTPALSLVLAALRRACPGFLAPGADAAAALTQTDTGIDLLLDLPTPPDLNGREALAAFAHAHDLARLMMRVKGDRHPEPVAVRRSPVVTFGTPSQVVLPPSPFLQPSVDGEALLIRLVGEALGDPAPGKTTVADLFSGLGTFSLPLSHGGFRVTAWDGDKPAIEALGQADPRIKAHTRDLFRDPLDARALAGFEALVLDPPRAGAAAQVREIVRMGENRPGTVVMVSCAPGTFARDARSLVDGGYRLDWVQPVDQFTWSHHVELVARFERKET